VDKLQKPNRLILTENLSGEAPWKVPTCNTEKEAGGSNEIDLREMDCRGRSWMELSQDRVDWWVLVLATSNLRVLIVNRNDHISVCAF
jgi:hypothetical protein